jgi:capsular exopolysaccharide synthesis family protein
MRTNLNYTLGQSEGAKRLLVTSPGPGEGKSTTAANLAVVFGLAGARVAIVDADLRRPTQHRIFRIPNTSGLTNLLASTDMRIQDVVQRTAHERVWILPSGPIPANPSELLGSGRMDELLRALEAHFDVVILDTAPALAVTDPVILSSFVSATVVVVQQGKTRSAELKHAVQRLAVAGHPIAGVVINRVVGGQHGYYYADYESSPTTSAEPGQSGQSSVGQRPLRPASAVAGSGARGPLEHGAETPAVPRPSPDVGETSESE